MTPKSIANNGAKNLASEIAEMLKAGQDVTIPGLGKFKVINKAARVGRNPHTGAEVQIPARKAVKFSQTSALKTILNPA